MIDRDILDKLDKDVREAVESAILTIHNSGVVQAQRESNYQSILHGDSDEDAGKLAQRIVEWRRRQLPLDSFMELAEVIKERVVR